jgi:hypothetical protein
LKVQQVDRPVALQIDNDRVVALATPPSPVLNTDDARQRCWFNRYSPDQAQQRVAADRHGEQARQAGPRFTPCGRCQGTLDIGKPGGAPLPEGCRRGQALGEDPARAAGLRAAEAAN